MAEEEGGAGGGGEEKVWTEGFSESQLGLAQNKGWENPAAAIDSYANLEKLMGGDPNHLIKLPSDTTDEAAYREVFGKLGMPETADAYSIEVGEERKEQGAQLQEMYHKAGLTNAQAKSMTEQFIAQDESSNKDFSEHTQAELETDKQALTTAWGAAMEKNTAIATQAAREFGIDAGMVDSIQDSMGFSATMKLLHAIGSKLGEATFESGDLGGGGNGVTSAEQAKVELAALNSSPDFLTPYFDKSHAGHKAAVERKSRLTQFAFPESK